MGDENQHGTLNRPQPTNAPEYEKSDFNYWFNFAMTYEGYTWDTSQSPPSYAGITKPMFIAYEKKYGKMSVEDVNKMWGKKPIDEKTVRDFYIKMYWNEYKLAQLPKKTSFLMFDWLMNSPGVIPIRKIQEYLGLDPDKLMGPLTISELQKKADDPDFLNEIEIMRTNFLISLGSGDQAGWLDRMGALKAYMNGMSLEDVKKNKNKFYPPPSQGGKRSEPTRDHPARKKTKATSPKTSSCNRCTFFATVDQYGLGPGVFPPDKMPDYPFHPNCHCGLEPVTDAEVADMDGGEFDPAAGEEYLRSLSEADRRELLGKDGAAAFGKDPASWQSSLEGNSEPTYRQCTIPAEILFGPDGEA